MCDAGTAPEIWKTQTKSSIYSARPSGRRGAWWRGRGPWRPDAIGEESVDAGAFVNFVEVRQRLAGVELLTRGVEDRRAVDIVQQALDQVGSGGDVLEALLILDADGVAAEVIGDAQGGDVHLALLENLRIGQVGLFGGAGDEGHAALIEPGADFRRFGVGDVRAWRRTARTG